METQAAALSRGSLVLNQAIRSEWLPIGAALRFAMT
jgi:hypothetical protein